MVPIIQSTSYYFSLLPTALETIHGLRGSVLHRQHKLLGKISKPQIIESNQIIVATFGVGNSSNKSLFKNWVFNHWKQKINKQTKTCCFIKDPLVNILLWWTKHYTHIGMHTQRFMCVCHMFRSPQRPEENIRSHEAGITGGYKASKVGEKLNSGPLPSTVCTWEVGFLRCTGQPAKLVSSKPLRILTQMRLMVFLTPKVVLWHPSKQAYV